MNKKKKLLILYDWFYPGFRAGGPIQSLTNLAHALIPHFNIYVITGARDLGSATSYDNIKIGSWNDILLGNDDEAINVFYIEKRRLTKPFIQQLFSEVKPAVIYLNGIFSYNFFLLPLLTLKKSDANVKVVVCPRGMLKEGALSGKSFKKKIYLSYLRWFGLLKEVYWHATTPDELNDINKHFPGNKGALVAPNIPKTPASKISFISKKPGELKLVYLSLINEHKNLLLLLQILNEVQLNVTLDIYGPVVDEVYWKKCMILIDQLTATVEYKGVIEPGLVQSILSKYHALILLTKGENFGHAIYESLSVGRPVITSYFTPWQHLFEKEAGANVNIENSKECIEKIIFFAQLPEADYKTFCSSAHVVATTHYAHLDAVKSYINLFS